MTIRRFGVRSLAIGMLAIGTMTATGFSDQQSLETHSLPMNDDYRFGQQYLSGGTIGPSCSADTNGDNTVNVTDLVNVILDWGTDGSANGGDVDGSGVVDVTDLMEVIMQWGPCP